MTALELRRQIARLTPERHPRIALVTDADTRIGLGGVLARSGLAYLDRNQVPRDLRGRLSPLEPSSDLYRRFLKLAQVEEIAVDRRVVSRAFRLALERAGIDRLDQAGLRAAHREGQRLCTIDTARWGSLGADVFVDSSVGAELAHRAGVSFLSGLGRNRLSNESISLGWIFEVYGLDLPALQRLESRITRRLLNPRDREAQEWLRLWPDYVHDRSRLLRDLLDEEGHPAIAYSNTPDSADQRSPALAIAFHGSERLPVGIRHSRVRLDPANIAVLPGRLSFNALLFGNSAEINRQVIAGGNRPLAWMRPLADDVTAFFLRAGATKVVWMPELYVRSADQIEHPVTPLTAHGMGWGGVPSDQALGTFTYKLDFRGGVPGVSWQPTPTFNFGYRHTLPREIGNLAVLGPSSGFGGLGEGAGRIVELNISVGSGVAIASALALAQGIPLAAVRPQEVARDLESPPKVYGRPSVETTFQFLVRRLQGLLLPVAERTRDALTFRKDIQGHL
jgi:hypothetical protein